MKSTPNPDRFDAGHYGVPVPTDLGQVIAAKTKPPRHRPGELFLRGPIPLEWLGRAAGLPGKALSVGLAVWFQAGITGKAEVKLTGAALSHFNVGRKAAYRALLALEAVGLIEVDRANGRCPLVRLIEVSPQEGASDS